MTLYLASILLPHFLYLATSFYFSPFVMFLSSLMYFSSNWINVNMSSNLLNRKDFFRSPSYPLIPFLFFFSCLSYCHESWTPCVEFCGQIFYWCHGDSSWTYCIVSRFSFSYRFPLNFFLYIIFLPFHIIVLFFKLIYHSFKLVHQCFELVCHYIVCGLLFLITLSLLL